jgi:hypothetical protein
LKCVSQSNIGLRCLGMSQALQTIAQAIDETEPSHKPVHALVPVGSAIFGHVPMSKILWTRRWTKCATVRASLCSNDKNAHRDRHQCGRFTRGRAHGSFASQWLCHRGKNALSTADLPDNMLNGSVQSPSPVNVSSGAP